VDGTGELGDAVLEPLSGMYRQEKRPRPPGSIGSMLCQFSQRACQQSSVHRWAEQGRPTVLVAVAWAADLTARGGEPGEGQSYQVQLKQAEAGRFPCITSQQKNI
jgi:hypothetical protein